MAWVLKLQAAGPVHDWGLAYKIFGPEAPIKGEYTTSLRAAF